jgi:lysyl-tRNA synthetase class 2
MATLKELRDERLRKLEQLKQLGINPYPSRSNRTNDLIDITGDFEQFNEKTVTVVGRIINIRKFGKIAFLVIKDQSSQLQLFLKEDLVDKLDTNMNTIGYDELPLLDIGDFVEAEGRVIKTQTGEISIEAKKLKLLTKSLRPMPLTPDGFTNKEERLRRRYIDMNVNQDVKDRIKRRSKFWQATRDFFNEKGFSEINIPVLEHTTGGADATPFVTHMNALDQDFFLRISHELPLKRLLGGGFEKVYDIGPRFRNENYSDEHLPEHVAMEWYWAFSNWEDGMKLMSDLYKYLAEKTFNTTSFKLNNFEVDFSKEWEKIDYAEAIKGKYNLDIFSCSLDDVKAALRDNKLIVEDNDNKPRAIDKLWKNIRKDIAGPAWLINTPTFISPLSKVNPNNPNTVERFQAVFAGSEMGNGFSELNDPIEQLSRFKEQQSMRDSGDDEAMMLDIDYIEMLEYGMPPACGFGFSERVFWTLENVTAREGVPFPQLRSEIDPTTRQLYPDLDLK